jgi:hypothetical protein
MRTLLAAAVLSTLVTFAACGGGGGGSGGGNGGGGGGNPNPNPPTPPTPVTFTVGPLSTIDPAPFYLAPYTMHETELGDVDENGLADLGWVFESTFTLTGQQIFDMGGQAGDGAGSFVEFYGSQGSVLETPSRLIVGDVLGVGGEGHVFAFQNDATTILVRTFGVRDVGMGPNGVGGTEFGSGTLAGFAVGDWNGDLVDDVVVADSAGVQVITWLSNGETGLAPEQFSALPAASTPDGMTAGNFDGDAFEDLVVSLGTAGYVVLVADGTGLFTAGTVVPLGSGRHFSDLATGDFDNDGRQDVAGVIEEAGQPRRLGVLLGNGDGTFDPLVPTTLEAALGATALVHVHAGDVNGDSRADLLFVAPALDRVLVALSDGVGGFVLATDVDLEGGGYATLGLGDVDHDGDLDLALGNPSALSVRVLLNDLH